MNKLGLGQMERERGTRNALTRLIDKLGLGQMEREGDKECPSSTDRQTRVGPNGERRTRNALTRLMNKLGLGQIAGGGQGMPLMTL